MTPPQNHLPNLLTLTEAAAYLRCSKPHLSKLTRGKVRGTKILPTIRLGRRVLIRKTTLLEWLSESVTSSVCR